MSKTRDAFFPRLLSFEFEISQYNGEIILKTENKSYKFLKYVGFSEKRRFFPISDRGRGVVTGKSGQDALYWKIFNAVLQAPALALALAEKIPEN
jgi:hypothetical protein